MAIDRDNQKGRIKPLSKYLEMIRPAVAQSSDEVAGVFMALKAKGKAVKIRERPKSDRPK